MKPLQLFKLLSDKTRLNIILLLKESESLCVCDIHTALNLSQPKTSRHLAMLRSAGVVENLKKGKWVYYSLSKEITPWVEQVLEHSYHYEKEKQNPIFQEMNNIKKLKKNSSTHHVLM